MFEFKPASEVICDVDDSALSQPKDETQSIPAELPYLSVVITVPGFFTQKGVFIHPKVHAEHFILRYEPGTLKDVGNALEKFVTSEAVKVAGGELLKRTVFGAIMAAVAIPFGLIKIASLVNNRCFFTSSRSAIY